MIALDKEDALPTNTTLTHIDNNLSPLENAAGVTLIEVEELQKKEKDDATIKIAEDKPSNSTTVQTGLESGAHLIIDDDKENKPANSDLTTTGSAVETGS